MKAQAFSSPHICIQPETSRKPVPDEAGFGMTIWPLYSGFVRSSQVAGGVSPSFVASTVL
ncbi:hypothetical protein D3C72_2106030 [compost metagenome]